ncbi:hypothetical protein ATK36_1249 [Amycolatopsis sulphurea]|uniref:Uncharacterized protein n=1 Tax=Amycolatopsis sulphurea TaxID=76022 RepID=A0A2A9G3C0_9PSEU|nr:hypothetical protein [Amycolatopsis sulphurea]PFG51076.1 hypothetical protein ATK36_6349 [Amycolatopsis sulphurea]PFG57653.1 hypothetical protein ATK36_1249 [Amycolatopsis sulphurea]
MSAPASVPDTARLTAVAARYVRDTPAPDPASISLYPGLRRIDIQPSVPSWDRVAVLDSLLIWTHQLTGITGDWWHTPGGDLHITLTGRGPCGVTVRVYDAFPYRTVRQHVALTEGASESVTPGELYRLALELRKGHLA